MIQQIVAERLIYWSQVICQQVQFQWSTRQPAGVTGNKEIHSTPPVVTPGIVLVELLASGQAAWEIEFGRGSLMDLENNPYLQQYLASSVYNSTRNSTLLKKGLNKNEVHPIQARPAGTYQDLDGNTHTASGKFPAGFDLELEYWMNRGDDRFAPSMPMHIIQDEIRDTMPLIASDLADSIARYIADEMVLTLSANIYI